MNNPRNDSKLFLSLAFTLLVLIQTIHSSTAGDLITPRGGHKAILLPNGKVLVVGGDSLAGRRVNYLTSTELYDPVTRTWRNTGNLNTPHGGEEFTATLLRNGKVLVVGGVVDFVKPLPYSAELYDPATGTWSPTGNLIARRAYHAATLLKNGKVLVVGGEKSGVLSSAELYNPVTGTWSPTGNLNRARSVHTATLLLNGNVLVVGGYAGGTSAELYDLATETWSPTGSLNTDYYWHTATLLPNAKVLLVGSNYFQTSITTELYDPATEMWTFTGSLNIGRLYHTATLLSKGKVLVAGGSDRPSSTIHNSVELYSPDTGTWTLIRKLNTRRAGHTTTILPNGKLLIAGGDNASGVLSSVELYDAPITLPKITSASTSGKKLFVFGKNFEPGAVILLNGKELTTSIDNQNPTTTLIGKTDRKMKPGDKLKVRNLNSTVSKEFTFLGQ